MNKNFLDSMKMLVEEWDESSVLLKLKYLLLVDWIPSCVSCSSPAYQTYDHRHSFPNTTFNPVFSFKQDLFKKYAACNTEITKIKLILKIIPLLYLPTCSSTNIAIHLGNELYNLVFTPIAPWNIWWLPSTILFFWALRCALWDVTQMSKPV